MQYCLFMHYQEGPEIGLTEEDMAPAREAFARYADDLDAAGVLVGTQVLQSAVASTTFTARNGTPTVQDGPFAETREQLGGYYLVEAKDLDAAIAIAARIPGARDGSIEVRPIMIYSPELVQARSGRA